MVAQGRLLRRNPFEVSRPRAPAAELPTGVSGFGRAPRSHTAHCACEAITASIPWGFAGAAYPIRWVRLPAIVGPALQSGSATLVIEEMCGFGRHGVSCEAS